MKAIFAKGALNALISILGASLIIFVISRLSGDPVALMMPIDAPQSAIDALKENLGLDRPIWEQYLKFLWNAVQGDFGRSYRWQMPALSLVLERLPATMWLATAAFSFSVALAVPLGVLSAVYRGSWIDQIGRIIAMLGQAVPSFWVGLILILVFSVSLNWLPAFGNDGIKSVILPAIALGWYPVAAQTRVIRSGMLEVLDSDYIRMARAVGTPERLLIWKYALRNALLPLVTIMGVYFASMLSGAFVVETVFAWPGLGRTVVEAVFSRDYPVVQACLLMLAMAVMLGTLLGDILQALMDPRVRAALA